MPIHAYYQASLSKFLGDDADRILGLLTQGHHHALEEQQRFAWSEEVRILKAAVKDMLSGCVFLEFSIPRMGKRADAVVIHSNIVFVIEFKVGASNYDRHALEQVEDYALDLKNFHEGSHPTPIVPILVATQALQPLDRALQFADDLVAQPLGTNSTDLGRTIALACRGQNFPPLDTDEWMSKGYRPTPTIVEAAEVLYRTHGVNEISRSDAGNLEDTRACVNIVVDQARRDRCKAICFITGVPGSGKTLAGLNIATHRSEQYSDEHAVFLSGNDPLVNVLREALARDKTQREGSAKKIAKRQVCSFIQNIRHFRDQYVSNEDVPVEKVVVFDEAQRAWTLEQACKFMQRKRGHTDFHMSEPEFLISVMDRHPDWCTVVCLIGGGQEINTGEAGISEWIGALNRKFPEWQVYVSPRIALPEYGSERIIGEFLTSTRVHSIPELHLAVSMRSFRAEALSDFVGHLIDNQPEVAFKTYQKIAKDYPLYLTRDLGAAKEWLRNRARGTERIGLVASSGAQRLRPEGIHIKADIKPEYWFLNGKPDVRSSFYLEEVASEFAVQGLELDWAGVCWDGDLHYRNGAWAYQSFRGSKWLSVKDESRRLYLKNAYRVLLTRARQGMVLFIPAGNARDLTRPPSIYDGTFNYLRRCGLPTLD